MIEEILSLVSDVGNVANAASGVIDLIQKVKSLMQGQDTNTKTWNGPQSNMMPNFQTPQMGQFQPQMQDPFHGGKQWIPDLQKVAKQFGNAWVPQQTQGLMGINMTGIWSPPMNPYDQTYIRQYGPYLNIIAGVGGVPTVYAEGVVNPSNWCIYVVGRNMQGAFVEARCQLFSNWTIQGMMVAPNAWGMPVQFPIYIMKVS